jgi:cell division protein FtsW (lipid II flippase)/pSer/pThr/pTyr-binding forkhead associated (FHA) protein
MIAIMEVARKFWGLFIEVSGYYTLAVRWIFPLLASVIFLRCVLPLSQVKKRKAVWGYLDIEDGSRMPLYHWENSIGRSKLSDVVINLAFASRSHAVLMYRNGAWTIVDMGSKGGVAVNGVKVEKSGAVRYGDVISLAGLKMVLVPPDAEPTGAWGQNADPAAYSARGDEISGSGQIVGSGQVSGSGQPNRVDRSTENSQPDDGVQSTENNQSGDGDKSAENKQSTYSDKSTAIIGKLISSGKPVGYSIKSGVTLVLIFIFQVLAGIQICVSMGSEVDLAAPLSFISFILAECLFFLIIRRRSKKHYELELLCCFLCGLNLAIIASASPGSLYKQLISIAAGMVVYVVFGLLIRDFGRARKLKYVLAAGALVLLVLNLVLGETRYGAKNWINLGFITFQPLEFVKVAFVIAGTATLDRLLTTRNMTAFIGFSGACILALVLIRDFGTAVVFFGTFIVIAFMRSGDVRTIALISSGAVIGAIAAVFFMPYIASRFASWGHAWEYANSSGYQQTRTMIAVASGGLLGVGGGNGYLENVAAADTDLVFGMLCEEWGLLVALIAVFIVIFFAIYAMLLTKNCRLSFYAIAACGAASIFLIQTGLNVFGSLDILPLTGVTIPFISNGGSSMIASWGLLAFVKSADDRVWIDDSAKTGGFKSPGKQPKTAAKKGT